MSVRIQFVTTTMFDYVLMFGMMVAGAGLLLKVLLKKDISFGDVRVLTKKKSTLFSFYKK